MSKLARVLVLAAMLAAANLAGLTAAHATDQPASTQDLRPPTERQVGESYRHRQVTAEQRTVAGDPRRPPSERQVGEPWRHRVTVPVLPVQPSGQPYRPVAWLGVLAAALALSGGLAMMAARRASRRVRGGQTA
jgi:hypothetical protein